MIKINTIWKRLCVVADQIRELAIRSQNTAGEIEALIESVVTDIENAIRDARQSVDSSTSLKSEIITNLDHSLSFLKQTGVELFERMKIIASAADDQQTTLSKTETAVIYNTKIGTKLINQVAKLQKALAVFRLGRTC